MAVSAVLSLLALTPAMAEQGNPVTGIGVSVEQSPGGVKITQDECKTKGGKITTHKGTGDKLFCDLPRAPAPTPVTTPTPAPTATPVPATPKKPGG